MAAMRGRNCRSLYDRGNGRYCGKCHVISKVGDYAPRSDPIIVRQNWLRAYDWTTDRGAAALNDYARANDPFGRVGRQQVSVEVSSVIRASPIGMMRR
jgi:type IV secretory pathway TrbF-like protein